MDVYDLKFKELSSKFALINQYNTRKFIIFLLCVLWYFIKDNFACSLILNIYKINFIHTI